MISRANEAIVGNIAANDTLTNATARRDVADV